MSARVGSALRRSAVPLAAAAGLWLLGRRTSAAVVAVLAVVLLAVGLAAPAVATRIDRLVLRAGRLAGTAVSYGIAALAWTFGVLPAWLLSGGRGSAAFRRPRARSGSAWQHPPPGGLRTPAGAPSAPQRAGSAADAAERGHPARRALVALALAAALTAAILVVGRPSPAPVASAAANGEGANGEGANGEAASSTGTGGAAPQRATATDEAAVEWDGLPVDDYAHEDEPWAPQLFGEYLQVPYRADPFLGHRLGDFDGKYVDIVDGRRVTYTPADPELTVWFFGGSTMFGIGQRDDQTIPSLIARQAERDGIRLRALNFGVSGHVSWVSLQQFEQALTGDELDPPDLAVFYEGVNEVALGAERASLGDVRPGSISRLTSSERDRDLVKRSLDNRGAMDWDDDRVALELQMSAGQYRRGAELVGHVAASYGVPVVHVWQPSPFAKRPQPSDDELWQRLGYDPVWLPTSTARYHEVRDRSGVDVIDLTTVLDEVTRPVYFDGGHTNELGASIIATAMYDRLAPQLRQLAGRP